MQNNLVGKMVTFEQGDDGIEVTGEVMTLTTDNHGNLRLYVWIAKEKKLLHVPSHVIKDIIPNRKEINTYKWYSILEIKPPLSHAVVGFFTEGKYENQIRLLHRYEEADEEKTIILWTSISLKNSDEVADDEWIPPNSTMWRFIDTDIPLEIIDNQQIDRLHILDL